MNSLVSIVQDVNVTKAVYESLELIGKVDKIIEPGSRVLIKPNVCTTDKPHSGVVTNCQVIEAVIKKVEEAGGVPIVGESCIDGTYEQTREALIASGIWDVAKDLGAFLVNFDQDTYQRVSIPHGKALRIIDVARTALDCDVRISVPVLKYHGATGVTLSLKNMKGCVQKKSRVVAHRTGLHQSIADYNTILCPNLAIIDGSVAGAWNEHLKRPKRSNAIIASFDPVAADAMGAQILGVDPSNIAHIQLAARMGLGISNLNHIEVVGSSIENNFHAVRKH